MAAIIGALRAELSASIAQFEGDMGKAADAVSGFSKRCESIAKGLEKIGTRMSIAITAPLVLLGTESVKAAKEVTASMAQVEAALASTGGRSGKTASELQKSAKALETLSTFDDDQILVQVSANLLRFGNITGAVFDRAQQAAVNLSARLGIDLSAAASTVGKALDQPVEGLQALSRLGIRFTEDQKKLIYNLVASGKGFEAQGLILKELEVRFGGAAAALRKASPDAVLQQQWRDLQENIGALLITIGTPLISKLTELTKWFNELSPAIQRNVVIGGILLALIGPLVTALSGLVTVIRLATVAIAFLTLTTSGWIVLIALAATGLAIYAAMNDKVRTAVGEQRTAHEALTKVLDDARAAGERVNETDGKMMRQKLELASATLQAARAQAQHNLELSRAQATNPADLKPGIHSVAKTKIERDQKALDDVKAAIIQNDADRAKLEAAIKNPPAAVVGQGGGKGGGTNFDLGPKADAVRAKLDALATAATKDAIDVRKFGEGGLDPLGESLERVDTQFETLKNTIEGHIKELKALSGGGAEANATMAKLHDQLGALATAHQQARDAAVAHYEAEKKIADLRAANDNLQTAFQIRDLQQASGRALAPMTLGEKQLQSVRDKLAEEQMVSEQKLADLEAERTDAAQRKDVDSIARLDSQIAMQREYYALVHDTTAEEIIAAQTADQAWSDFADGVSNQLQDMIVNFDFNIRSVGGLLRRLVADLLKPATDMAGGFLSTGVKALFSGFFADGGFIPPGQWGIAGEAGMEPVFGGRTGATVVSSLGNEGGRGDIYIDARGADTAAVQRLASVVAELQRTEGGRVTGYAADARQRTRKYG